MSYIWLNTNLVLNLSKFESNALTFELSKPHIHCLK